MLNFKANDAKGFSLLELVVALGIGSLILLLGSSMINTIFVNDRKSAQESEAADFLHLVTVALSQSGNSLVASTFDPTVTFAGKSTDNLDKIRITPRAHMIRFRHQSKNYSIGNGSTTMELANASEKVTSNNRGIMLSRCIERDKVLKDNWQIADIAGLDYFPLPIRDSKGELSIHCCSIKSRNAQSCQTMDQKSKWRSRVFRISERDIKIWPDQRGASPVIGVGFFRYLNDPSQPSLLTHIGFVIANDCVYTLDREQAKRKKYRKCTDHQFHAKTESLSLEQHFYDAGIINMGH